MVTATIRGYPAFAIMATATIRRYVFAKMATATIRRYDVFAKMAIATTRRFPVFTTMATATICRFPVFTKMATATIRCFPVFTKMTNDLYNSKFKQWADNYPCVQVVNDGTSNNENRLGAVSCLQLVIEKFRIDDNVIVIGGDLLFYEDFHLCDVLQKYETLYKDNKQANLVLSYNCKEEETRKYGIIETDENRKIIALLEKPSSTHTSSRQACPCFYILSKHTLPLVKEFLTEKKNAPITEKDAPGHFLSWLVIRKPVYSHPVSGRFDVGNLETYIKCNHYFKDKRPLPDYLK